MTVMLTVWTCYWWFHVLDAVQVHTAHNLKNLLLHLLQPAGQMVAEKVTAMLFSAAAIINIVVSFQQPFAR